MYHRRLNKRLENCKDWTEFTSTDENHKILSGTADYDTYYTTEMPGMEGKPFEGVTLRLFNPQTKLWSFILGCKQSWCFRSANGWLV